MSKKAKRLEKHDNFAERLIVAAIIIGFAVLAGVVNCLGGGC